MAELSMAEFRSILGRIDGRGYKAYKDIQRHSLRVGEICIHFDHVQGDPFASPSVFRISVPQSFPEEFWNSRHRRVAIEDMVGRKAHGLCVKRSSHRGIGSSGYIGFPRPGQEILERSVLRLFPDRVELRVFVGLPAAGRRILSGEAWKIVVEDLPFIARNSLYRKNYTEDEMRERLQLADEQEFIRSNLDRLGLVAFVANGSILPRRSGVDQRPMSADRAVAFKSPPEFEIEIELPTGRSIKGMGIKEGITLIAGGGYHGKSTLLEAVQLGIYNHVAGDGREFVITNPTAVKIRAEDGRRVASVDISPFIYDLPSGIDVKRFFTEDASGSTSMAANMIEAIEAGSTFLLIDEDTAATNFMIRDARMQRLVKKEPIVPLIDRARELYEKFGVSMMVVIGGAGDYLDVADSVIMMEDFVPYDVTDEARVIAEKMPTGRRDEPPFPMEPVRERVPLPSGFDPSKGKKEEYVKVGSIGALQFGGEIVDLSAVETIVSIGQVNGIGNAMLKLLRDRWIDGRRKIKEILEGMEEELMGKTVDVLFRGYVSPTIEEFRMMELAAAINRLRTLKIRF